jgi:hypothetical protein
MLILLDYDPTTDTALTSNADEATAQRLSLSTRFISCSVTSDKFPNLSETLPNFGERFLEVLTGTLALSPRQIRRVLQDGRRNPVAYAKAEQIIFKEFTHEYPDHSLSAAWILYLAGRFSHVELQEILASWEPTETLETFLMKNVPAVATEETDPDA